MHIGRFSYFILFIFCCSVCVVAHQQCATMGLTGIRRRARERERERDAAARATTDTDKQCPYNALHPSFRQGYQPCFIDAKLYIKCMWNIRSTGNIDPSSNFHRNNIGNMMCLCVCLGSGSLFFVAYQHDHNIRVYILPIWQTGEQASVWMVLKFTLRHCWKKNGLSFGQHAFGLLTHIQTDRDVNARL